MTQIFLRWYWIDLVVFVPLPLVRSMSVIYVPPADNYRDVINASQNRT